MMASWFSKCTKVVEYVHKIEDESSRTYIFEYFFKFISFRYYREKKNSSITKWIIDSKFDQFIYLIFERHKYLSQSLFDHMTEALANIFLVPEILRKFDYFRLMNHYEMYHYDFKKARPQSMMYLVGILYAVIDDLGYSLENAIDKQGLHDQKGPQVVTGLNQDTQDNKMFILPAAARKKEEPPNQSMNTIPFEKEVLTLDPRSQRKIGATLGIPQRTNRVRESVIQVNIVQQHGDNPEVNIAGKSMDLKIFVEHQANFLENMQNLNTGLSLAKFAIRILRYCLRRINFSSLTEDKTSDFNSKNRTKEKEYFRYLHLVVDLSAQKTNHFIILNPIFIRDILYFLLHTESENTYHYHRVFDCIIL